MKISKLKGWVPKFDWKIPKVKKFGRDQISFQFKTYTKCSLPQIFLQNYFYCKSTLECSLQLKESKYMKFLQKNKYHHQINQLFVFFVVVFVYNFRNLLLSANDFWFDQDGRIGSKVRICRYWMYSVFACVCRCIVFLQEILQIFKHGCSISAFAHLSQNWTLMIDVR